MPSDIFLLDDGHHRGRHYTTRLYRHHIIRKTWTKHVWRETRPGEPHPSGAIQYDDIDGKPVDGFGLPLLGNFIDYR